MSDSGIPVSFIIGAQIRIAGAQGVPVVIRKRGDENYGAIILKIDLLNGTSRVLMQARMDDEVMWNPVSRNDPMPEAEAERYLAQQAQIDPDSWVVEIEDKQGRHWFPGGVVKF